MHFSIEIFGYFESTGKVTDEHYFCEASILSI